MRNIDVDDNVKGCKLRVCNKKWYRADMKGVNNEGERDVDKIEEKSKKMFTDIPETANPELMELPLVADNDLPLVSIAHDQEMTNMILCIYYKHEKLP